MKKTSKLAAVLLSLTAATALAVAVPTKVDAAYTIHREYAISPGTAATSGKVIMLHSTDDVNATALQLAMYEHRVWRTDQTFVHYGVDDTSVYQVGPEGRVAWGAGNINRRSPVQIELCEFSDRSRALAAYYNWIAFARDRAKAWGASLSLDSGDLVNGFKTHQWASATYGGSDHEDPMPYLSSIGISKAQLAHDLLYGAGTGTVSGGASNVVPQQPASGGSYTFTETTNIRTAPSLSASIVGHYGKGQRVNYSSTMQADGYTWMRYTAYSGATRYVAQVAGRAATEPLTVDGYMGPKTIAAWQRHEGTPADGRISPASLVVMAAQRRLGVRVDGYIGPQTVTAMQRALGTYRDGYISSPSLMVKAMQRALNAGTLPF